MLKKKNYLNYLFIYALKKQQQQQQQQQQNYIQHQYFSQQH